MLGLFSSQIIAKWFWILREISVPSGMVESDVYSILRCDSKSQISSNFSPNTSRLSWCSSTAFHVSNVVLTPEFLVGNPTHHLPFPTTHSRSGQGLVLTPIQVGKCNLKRYDMVHKWDNKAQQTMFETDNLGHCFPRCHTGFGLCMCLLVLRCPIPRMTSHGNSGMTSLENPTYQMV